MSENHNHDHGKSCCASQGSGSGVCQSLEEMEFERGLWYAAMTHDTERVRHLLQKGMSPNAKDAAGYTALHYAARHGAYESCKTLLENKADVNDVTKSGRATPLHRAATQGHKHIVELLLQYGADVNILDADMNSALHRAIASRSVSVCEILLPKTDLTIVNSHGLTPLQLALEKGNIEIIYMFENHVSEMKKKKKEGN